jgi:hypothetical protein
MVITRLRGVIALLTAMVGFAGTTVPAHAGILYCQPDRELLTAALLYEKIGGEAAALHKFVKPDSLLYKFDQDFGLSPDGGKIDSWFRVSRADGDVIGFLRGSDIVVRCRGGF